MENEQNLKQLCKYCFNILTYVLKNDDKEKEPEFPKEFIGKSYKGGAERLRRLHGP